MEEYWVKSYYQPQVAGDSSYSQLTVTGMPPPPEPKAPPPPAPKTPLDLARGVEHLPPSFMQWMHAIDDELVTTHVGTASLDDTYEEARRKLTQLIAWHVAVALDPAVNGGFELVPTWNAAPHTLAAHQLRSIREIFLANGFTIKEGETDLKPYVYQAARALLWVAGRYEESAHEVAWQYLYEDQFGRDVWLTDVTIGAYGQHPKACRPLFAGESREINRVTRVPQGDSENCPQAEK